LGFAAKLLGSFDKPLIPIGPLLKPVAYSRAADKCKHFCVALENVSPVHRNLLVRIRSLCNNIRECCSVFLKRSPILMISPICFHLNRWKNGKCNCSLEEHLQNSKTWFLFTGRPRAFNFCQKFEFYLVTQFL
jgi:hypothetical protein